MGFLTQMIKSCNSSGSQLTGSDSLLYQALSVPAGTTSISTRYATLPIELIDNPSDTTFSTSANLGSTTADAAVLVYRVAGSMTINSGVTVTPAARKLGTLLIVNGDLNISGTLSMTARGAANVAGQRLYIVQMNDSAFEVPAVGGSGGLGLSSGAVSGSKKFGLSGTTGVSGATGGGGSGGLLSSVAGSTYSGAGAAGTSFSGGTGGGGVGRLGTAGSGAVNGGTGGQGYVNGDTNWSAGGGAGNPGGASVNSSYPSPGDIGTGGLLIIYVKGQVNITGTGIISSDGSNGGRYGSYAGGGGSGAGSILLFSSKTITNSGTLRAVGGLGYNNGINTGATGGRGGAGSIILQDSRAITIPMDTTAFFQLESTTNDYSGYGLNAVNAGLTFANIGGVNGALCSTINTYATLPAYSFSSNFAVAVKVYVPTSTVTGMNGILRTNNGGWNGYGLEFVLSATANIGFLPWADWCLANGANPGQATSTNLNFNQWYSLVAQRDGTKIYLYVNGVLVGSVASTNVTSTLTAPIIGNYINGNTNTTIPYYMRKLRVYNRVLTLSEISGLTKE